jgi:hypothetical protein
MPVAQNQTTEDECAAVYQIGTKAQREILYGQVPGYEKLFQLLVVHQAEQLQQYMDQAPTELKDVLMSLSVRDDTHLDQVVEISKEWMKKLAELVREYGMVLPLCWNRKASIYR